MNWKTKSGFGVVEIGLSAIELLLQVYLLELYIVAGLSPFMAGTALAFAVIWDAVSDPLMGLISDRTRSGTAVGKRLSYFFAGSIFMGIAFAFLFNPLAGSSQWSLFLHLLMWYMILNTALTLVGVPHLAIISDLSSSGKDRTDFFSWRLVFGGVGLLLGLSFPILVATFQAQSDAGFSAGLLLENRGDVGRWVGVVAFFFAVVTGLVVWKPLSSIDTSSTEKDPILFSMRHIFSALRSTLFIRVVAGFAFIALGRAFNSSLALLFYKHRLGFTESEIALLLLVLTLSIMGSVPFWLLLSRRFEKGRLCFVGVVMLTLLTGIAYPLLAPGLLGPVLIVAAFGGTLVGCVALLESLFSDVIERDEKTSGIPISGVYYGLWKMIIKLARALGLVFSGILLSLIGFVEGSTEQPPAVKEAITWAFGPGVALFFGMSAWFIFRSSQAFRFQKKPDALLPSDTQHQLT